MTNVASADEPVADHAVSVVVVRADRDSGLAVTLDGQHRVDLADPGVIGSTAEAALLESVVRLTAPEDLTVHDLAVLRAQAVPALFRSSPWLSPHRVVVLGKGDRCRIGTLVLGFMPGVGLSVGADE
jgi:hypothetical protein